MALNANNIKQKQQQAKRAPQDELEIGNYPCRVAQVLDMGVHPVDVWDDKAHKYVQDDTKAPQNFIRLTYEFTTEFMKDENGVEDEAKPRWYSEEIKLLPLTSDLATSTKRYNALDPKGVHEGDFAKLTDACCTVTIGHKGNGKAKIGSVSPVMKGMVYAELKNPPKVFTLDDPDLDIFNSQPQWIKDRITSNLYFEGSKLQKLLAGEPVGKPKVEEKAAEKPVQDAVEGVGDDSNPW